MNPEGRMLNSVKSFFGSVASLAFYPVWTIVHVLFHIQKVANVLHVSLKGSFGQIKSKSAPNDGIRGTRTASHILLVLNDASFTLPRHTEQELNNLNSYIRGAFASGARIVSVYNMHGWFQGVKQTLIALLRKENLGLQKLLVGENGRPLGSIRGMVFSEGEWEKDLDGDCGALFFDDRENGKQRLIDCARELCGDAKRSKESSREIHASDIEEHLHKKLRCRNEACFAQVSFITILEHPGCL
mmetsp:Transcript_27620/g.62638  ORF Transcript_27620/g.62638 Transcript_27620/m.62638 type:complete len:243 (-) Transcript_27620:2-730(-)